MSTTRQISNMSIIKGDFLANYWWNFMPMSDHGALHTFCIDVHWVTWAVSAVWLLLGSVCERSFFVCFWPSFRYSNSFMVEYLNGKIGIRHRPNDDWIFPLVLCRCMEEQDAPKGWFFISRLWLSVFLLVLAVACLWDCDSAYGNYLFNLQ